MNSFTVNTFQFHGKQPVSKALKTYKDHRIFCYFQKKQKSGTAMIKGKIFCSNAVTQHKMKN